MPRKLKEVIAEVDVNVDAGENAPQTEENEAKTQITPKSLMIDSSYSEATVVKLDSEGVDLLFAQNEDFLPLSEGIVRQLSRGNRSRYSIARQFHDTWRGKQDEQFTEMFSVDKEFVGKASDKINDLTIRSGIHHRWARPDRVNYYLEKGYRVLSADDAKTYLGAKGTHHEISKNGKTELVLVGIPQAMFEKNQKAKVEDNKRRALAWKSSGVQRIEEQGVKGFVATDDDKSRPWAEIESPESES